MGNVIELFPSPAHREELLSKLHELRTMLDELDMQEPEDMNSEGYELWGQAHEDLEDQIDDILDLLDEE
ncbi:MAG: hypothetical protein IKB79_03305 [Oscillospiraceae bacterium]|nr:hypothetical protein [Oscillospiraceae bacterium]